MSNISRRSFLKASGVTIGASAIGGGLLSLSSCSPDSNTSQVSEAQTVDENQVMTKAKNDIKVKLCYCSPTGTTRNASLLLAQAISDDVEIIDQTSYVSREKEIEFDADDLVIMSAPTYAGQIPIIDNLWTNLKGNDTPCIAVSCFGNRACENGLVDTKDIVSKNGFNVIGGIKIVTDHALGAFLGRGRPDIDDQKIIKTFAEGIQEKIASGTLETVEFVGDPDSYFYDKYDSDYGKRFKSSAILVYDEEKCVKCGTCAAECTGGAIDPTTLAIDTELCADCQRCTYVCPYSARHFDMDRSFEYKNVRSDYWPRKEIETVL